MSELLKDKLNKGEKVNSEFFSKMRKDYVDVHARFLLHQVMGISAESFAENKNRDASMKPINKEAAGVTDEMQTSIEGIYPYMRYFDGEMASEYGASLFYQIFRKHFQGFIGDHEISDIIKNIAKHSDLYISPEFCKNAVFKSNYTGPYKCQHAAILAFYQAKTEL